MLQTAELDEFSLSVAHFAETRVNPLHSQYKVFVIPEECHLEHSHRLMEGAELRSSSLGCLFNCSEAEQDADCWMFVFFQPVGQSVC